MQEGLERLDAAEIQSPPRPLAAANVLDMSKPDISKQRDTAKIRNADETETSRVEYAPNIPQNDNTPERMGSPKVPMLIVAVLAAVFAVTWQYVGREETVAALDDARLKLTAMTEELKAVTDAKAAAEVALADAQAKLATEQAARLAAETAIANVRSALAAIHAAVGISDVGKPGDKPEGPAAATSAPVVKAAPDKAE